MNGSKGVVYSGGVIMRAIVCVRRVLKFALLGTAMHVATARAADAPATADSSPAAGQTAGDTSPAPTQSDTTGASAGDIVVTATRQAQTISRVPISVTAFNEEAMDQRGLKTFEDVARFTPGVTFSHGNNQISIRGIVANGGAGTTGIYLDDTPIQLRSIGFSAQDTLPAIFDLDRVEVLRGPQGTLFGAGSEGGTVRYITPQPPLDKATIYSRAEVSGTAHGGTSWEVGSAIGMPLITDQLGLRVSVYHRHDAGYIDHVDNATDAVVQKNWNYGDVTTARAALAWQPAPNLTITPSILWQQRTQNASDTFFVGLSNVSAGSYLNSSPENHGLQDHWVQPSLNAKFDGHGFSVIENFSFFDRHDQYGYDGTIYTLSYLQQYYAAYATAYNPAYAPFLVPDGINKNLPYFYDPNTVINNQKIYTQELRIQSNNPNARLTWVLGGFYQWGKERSSETLYDSPSSENFYNTVFGYSEEDFNGGPDTIPGVNYDRTAYSIDSQVAVFGDATLALWKGLKITGGVRYAITKFDFTGLEQYPGVYNYFGGSTTEHPVTPKAGASWQIDRNNLVYATWAKGYRVGGVNASVNPQHCATDLAALGITSAPETYKSDTVKSIEVGTKNKLFSNNLQLSGSIYQVTWYGIQQNIYLPSCGLQFTGNLGNARSRGFDFQATVTPIRGITLDTAIGYNHARLLDLISLGGQSISRPGEAIEGPPWQITVGGQYDFTAAGQSWYLRSDVQHLSELTTPTPSRDPLGGTYNATQRAPSALTDARIRAGIRINGLDLSVFVNNLFDAKPYLSYAAADKYSILYEATILRPRTFGLTATLRQ
jgi:outer membrane receptor protein involved in Fe transport